MTQDEPHPQTLSPPLSGDAAVPFETTEQAWFWFIKAQQARNDGARFNAGLGSVPRPCEPIDILKIMDRLYRQRHLTMNHFRVLRHYGQRQISPDPKRIKEQRALNIWNEALGRLEAVFISKGIVKALQDRPSENWAQEALVYSNLRKSEGAS